MRRDDVDVHRLRPADHEAAARVAVLPGLPAVSVDWSGAPVCRGCGQPLVYCECLPVLPVPVCPCGGALCPVLVDGEPCGACVVCTGCDHDAP